MANEFQQEVEAGQPGFLSGGGEMGELIRGFDWSKTKVGPVEGWPQSLRTALSICLNATMPISIIWGKELVQFYNNAYLPIAIGRHPRILGGTVPLNWPDTWPALQKWFEGVFEGHPTYEENALLVTNRKGFDEECYYTMSFSPIRDESGQVGGVFHAIQETTTQILHERRLRSTRALSTSLAGVKDSNELFLKAVEVLSDNQHDIPFLLVYQVEKNNTLTLHSLCGVETGLKISPPSINLHPSDPASAEWAFLQPVLEGKIHVVNHLQDLCPVQANFWSVPVQRAVLLPVTLPGKSTPEAIILAGLSPRLSLDDSYSNFFEQIAGQLSASLANIEAYETERKRAEALAQIDRAKTTFFSNVSHEFRTPLTLMLGPIEDVLAKAHHQVLPENRELLTIAHRNGLRLQKLVNTMLDFTRIEAGRIQASYRPTDLSRFTADLASNFRSVFEKAGLKLTVDCPALPEPVFVDHDLWEKIILNLLSNAFKHTFQGEIRITMRGQQKQARVVIADTGIGILPDQLPHLFERFHRVPNARSRTHEGSGIGLALIHELVKLHGGSIAVESVVDQGTTFTVSIPFGKDHLPADRLEAETTLPSTSVGINPFMEEALLWLHEDDNKERLNIASGAGEMPTREGIWPAATPGADRKARILVADDNADMREYLHRLLAPHSAVELVADGVAALEAARRELPDLVVADIMMPKMDGLQLLTAIRQDESLQSLPVILLSARAGEEARVEGLLTGADDYLVKPFSSRELLARVRVNLDLARVRREAQEAIRKSEARLRAIVEATPECIKIVAPDGTLQYMNRAGVSMAEAGSAEGLAGSSVYDMIAAEHRNTWIEQHQRVCRGENLSWEFEIVGLNGTRRQVETHAVPLPNPDGTFSQLAVTRDITQRKWAEETLKLNNQQLTRINADLDNFIYTASHDLKAPILNIEGLLKALERELGKERPQAVQVQELYRFLNASVSRFKATIGDLTDVARISKENVEDVDRVPLATVLEEVILDLQTPIQESEARLDVRLAGEEVRFSRKNLKSVLYNLLSNALKYRSLDRKLQIRITCQRQESYQVLSVADNGLGMDMRQEDKIFALFKRLHAHVEGTGIGLYMVKKILENAGGKIEVESQVGVGSTFKAYFKQ